MVDDTTELRKIDKEFLWHPYTKFSSIDDTDFPIIEKAEGVYLYDTNGYRYFDVISSWWSCNLGHSNQEIIDTIKDQAMKLQHSIIGNLSHPQVIELSKKLCDLFDDNARHVLYASDGACAVEAALKIAIQFWYNIGKKKRNKFVCLEGDYHGDTLGAMSVGYVQSFHKQFQSSIIPAYQAEAPFCKKCKYNQTEDNCSVECFKSMEDILIKHEDTLAAVIVEPLCQGASGMRIYSPKYLKELSKCCAKYNIILIVDEIAMGFGRTGKMFAHQHADINPDIVCVGKGLSGGTLPLSATIVKNTIYKTFSDTPKDNTFYHGHTFAGNPIATAVALKVLEIYEKECIVDNVDKLGKALKKKIAEFESLPTVTNTRCLGMVGAVELKEGNVSYKSKKMPRTEAVRRCLLEQSTLIRPLGNVIYFMMPLVVSKFLLIKTCDLVYEAVEKVG